MTFHLLGFSDFHHPNWRTPWFFRGVETTNQIKSLKCKSWFLPFGKWPPHFSERTRFVFALSKFDEDPVCAKKVSGITYLMHDVVWTTAWLKDIYSVYHHRGLHASIQSRMAGKHIFNMSPGWISAIRFQRICQAVCAAGQIRSQKDCTGRICERAAQRDCPPVIKDAGLAMGNPLSMEFQWIILKILYL